MLPDSILSQPLSPGLVRRRPVSGTGRMRSPRSASSSASEELGPRGVGVSISSSLSSLYGSYLGLEGEPRASDLTTSPLQMGHVRRLVVSHGVLKNSS